MVLLLRSYGGYPANVIVQLPTSVEQALVSSGLASLSAGPVTAGNQTTNQLSGRSGIAAAGTQVIVSNPGFTAESKFVAVLSNATADTTATSVTRIVPAAGQVTFILNAATTAAVAVDWVQLNPNLGMTVTQ